MDDSTRRRFVRTTGLASIALLAGCGGDDDDGGGAQAPDNESNETGDEAGTEGDSGDDAGGDGDSGEDGGDESLAARPSDSR